MCVDVKVKIAFPFYPDGKDGQLNQDPVNTVRLAECTQVSHKMASSIMNIENHGKKLTSVRKQKQSYCHIETQFRESMSVRRIATLSPYQTLDP